MIGVFIDGVRIGSVMHFPYQKYWVAYGYKDVNQQFKTRKAAVAWLVERHNAALQTC